MKRMTRSVSRASSSSYGGGQKSLSDLPEETVAHILQQLSVEDLLLHGMHVSQEWRHAALQHVSALAFGPSTYAVSSFAHTHKLLILAARMRWWGLRTLTLDQGIDASAIYASFCVPLQWSCFAATTQLFLDQDFCHCDQIPVMMKALPNLVLLSIDSSDADSASTCRAIDLCSLSPTRLEILTIKQGDTWFADNIEAFIGACPHLQALQLYGLDQARFTCSTPLTTKGLPHLRSLALSNMGGLNNEGLLGLVGKLPLLTHLVVEEWNEANQMDSFEATPDALTTLVLSCPSLRELDYWNCVEMFSLGDLRRIGQKLPECVMLNEERSLTFDDGVEYVGRKFHASGRSLVDLFGVPREPRVYPGREICMYRFRDFLIMPHAT